MNDEDDMTAIDAMNEHIDRMIKAVPKTVFGDLYRVLLHSWQLTYLVGTPIGDLGCKSPFERAHEDFVAILKTANLGDLVEKLHDALAKQDGQPRASQEPPVSVEVSSLATYVGCVEVFSHDDGAWRELTAFLPRPRSAAPAGHIEVVLGDRSATLRSMDKVLIRPLPRSR